MTAALAYAKRKKAETGKPVTVTTLVIKAVAMVCTTVLPHLGDAGRHAHSVSLTAVCAGCGWFTGTARITIAERAHRVG